MSELKKELKIAIDKVAMEHERPLYGVDIYGVLSEIVTEFLQSMQDNREVKR